MLLAIDPSINDIGLALLDSKGNFIRSWHIKSPQGLAHQKIDYIATQLKEVINSLEQLNQVIIEHTRFFSRNNNSSHASAQKLNLAKGTIFGVCRSLTQIPVQLVWIPGFNKQSAQLLARSCQLPQKITQHEIDAFWLGNTWLNTNEVIRQSYLEQADL